MRSIPFFRSVLLASALVVPLTASHAARPGPDIAVLAPGDEAGPVAVFNSDGTLRRSFFAYDPAFQGGVRVATGDVNGDGVVDIVTGAGVGGGPHVKVFNGVTGAEESSFFAFDPGFLGGIQIATGDVSGDGRADIVVGVGSGAGPQVRVFDGLTGNTLASFFAYDAGFTGGITVATGDINGDGVAEIITGTGAGGGSNVKVFDGRTQAVQNNFLAFAPNFLGGISVAGGDIDGDGFGEIIVGAGPGGGPQVKVFDGLTGALESSFFAYDPGFTGGIFVGAGRVDADTRSDVIVNAFTALSGPPPGALTNSVPSLPIKIYSGADLGAPPQSFIPPYTGAIFTVSGSLGSLPNLVAVPETSTGVLALLPLAIPGIALAYRRRRASV